MMKRFLIGTLSLALVLSLTACGGSGQGNGGGQSDAGTPASSAQPTEQESGTADKNTADAQDLPFDITGEYVTNDGSSDESMLVEAVSDGYVVTFGGNVSKTLTAEYDKEMNEIRLNGEAATINGQPPSEGSNWHVMASLRPGSADEHAGGYVIFTDSATNDENTRINAYVSRLTIRPGVYSYWNTPWAADGSGYDWDNAVLSQCMTLEYDKGLFRFTFADGYASDWVSPTGKSWPRYEFMEIAVTGSGKEATTATIYLEDAGVYSYAMVNLYAPDKSAYLLETNKACTPLDEGYTMDYVGTYESAPDASQKHTVVVDKNSLTVDGRYTMEFTLEDLAMQWRPLMLTDTQSGQTEQANLSFYEYDGALTCNLNSYSGSVQIQSAEKK